jgi:hypothetical protein
MNAIHEAWAYLRWVTSYFTLVRANNIRAMTREL